MIGDHPPERARVRRPDRLALVEHGGTAVQQRRVDDVGVADDPADVGRRPPHLARLDPVDVVHRPFQRDRMATVVTHDPLRPAGGARGVEDVERVGGRHRHALGRLGIVHRGRPVEVTLGMQRRLQLRTLEHDAAPRPMLGLLDCAVQQRLVIDQPARLDSTGGRDDHRRPRVIDPPGQLVGGETAEHDRMDRADPRAGEHRDRRLGHHRHVDDHPVAVLHSLSAQGAGEACDLVAQLAVRVTPDGVGHRRVVDQRHLIGATTFDVTIERVVTGVQAPARKPPIQRRAAVVEHALGRSDPVDRPGRR